MTFAPVSNPSNSTLPVTLDDASFAIATHDLVRRFGRDVALDGVNLQVPEGAVYALAGANGAGKSTLLLNLLGLLRPDAGRAEVLGLDPSRRGAEVRAQVGWVSEAAQTGYRWMKVGRLLEQYSAYYSGWDSQYVAQLIRSLGIEPERRLSELSKGQVRRIQLVLAMAHRPPVLLLDEPTDGLDPVARDDVLGILTDHLAKTGATVLVSTHLIHEIEGLADHIGVLRGGRLVAQLSRQSLGAGLRQYRFRGPEGCPDLDAPPGVLDRRAGFGRERIWTAWGDERDLISRIGSAGGEVQDITSPSLSDAVLTLMRA